MLELPELREIIKADPDDDPFLSLAWDAAVEYMEAAVGAYPENSKRADLITAFLVSDMYEKRQFTVEKPEEKGYIIRSMLHQLELEKEMEETI